MSAQIIAEPGCTHEGDLATMHALIDAAAQAGATAYKSQWVSNADALAARRHAADHLASYRWLQYPLDWHPGLAEHCRRMGLWYGVTTYLPADVGAVDPYVDFHKVASFEAEAHDLLAAHAVLMARNARRLLISLGMGATLDAARDAFTTRGPFRVDPLYCVSAYPTPRDQMGLRAITESDFVGLSDHCDPDELLTGAVAVAAGASIVERHIRLDDCDPANPDYAVALAPAPFAQYVELIRAAERLMGGGDYDDATRAIKPAEAPMLAHKVRT